jgi:RNA polymerase sigma-70 factor (ECF subfamily)
MSHPDHLVRQSAEWIERIRHGDEAAFEHLYRAFVPGLIAFAVGYVSTRTVAEELVQDLFLTLWRKRGELTIGAAVPTYLFTATRNLAIDHLRRERRLVHWDEAVVGRIGDAAAPPETVLLEMLDLQDAIGRLPARCRLIFTLSRQHDMTYEQIAQSLGLSIKTVEVQMSRALHRLRAWLLRSEG